MADLSPVAENREPSVWTYAVPGYLNVLNNGVEHDMTPPAVVSGFQSSFDTSDYGSIIENFFNFNEQGCPLN